MNQLPWAMFLIAAIVMNCVSRTVDRKAHGVWFGGALLMFGMAALAGVGHILQVIR